MSTKEILDRLKAAESKATAGPWHHDADSELGQLGDVTIWADGEIVACQVTDDGESGYVCNMEGPSHDLSELDATTHHNADFIVLSRAAMPALVEALERIEALCNTEQHSLPHKQKHGGWLMPIGTIRAITKSALAPLKEVLP